MSSGGATHHQQQQQHQQRTSFKIKNASILYSLYLFWSLSLSLSLPLNVYKSIYLYITCLSNYLSFFLSINFSLSSIYILFSHVLQPLPVEPSYFPLRISPISASRLSLYIYHLPICLFFYLRIFLSA